MIISINPEAVFRKEADSNGTLYLRNEVFILNKTSIFIWQILQTEKGVKLEKLKKILTHKYKISEKIIEQDLMDFFERMKATKLIEVKEGEEI